MLTVPSLISVFANSPVCSQSIYCAYLTLFHLFLNIPFSIIVKFSIGKPSLSNLILLRPFLTFAFEYLD